MDSDHRKAPRIDFHLDVAVKGKQGSQQVRNLSPEGLFLETEDPWRYTVGEEIRVVMKLPNEETPLALHARVAHVSEIGVGLEFVNLKSEDAMSLEHCFHIFKHTTPLPGS
jgi:Tfp pilus assembly protein PilZ